jgi:hypothetical protein
MTINTTLTKRPALYKGEVGFFPDNRMSADDIAPIAMHEETMHRITSERNLQALKFLWALVHKTTDNTDCFLDKDDAMEKLKINVGYSKAVYDPHTREMVVRGKSLKKISAEALRTLTDRIADVVCADLMPGMKRNDLYREIEEMIAGKSA